MVCIVVFFFFKQKTAYEMRISDWSSDVCSSDLGKLERVTVSAQAWQTKARCRLRAFPVAFAHVSPAWKPLHVRPTHPAAPRRLAQIGRASCRERGLSVRVDLGGRRYI